MANRLQRVLAMDEAMKARDEPKAGMHDVVNADGSVTQIPYMEDKRGRRTVMTREGPRVIRGHEGKNLPGDAIGEGLRNVLGGLFGKGGVPGGTPPFVPAGEDYFDMSGVGSSQTSSDDLIDLGGKKYIKRTITTPKGSYFEIRDPDSGQLLQSSQTQDSETTTPNNASQTNIFASQPKVEESYGTLPNGQQVIVEKTTTGNKTQIRTLDPNTRQQIGGASQSEVPVTPQSEVPVTPQGQQSGVNPFGANPRELSQKDIDAMSLLSEDKRSKYQDPTTPDAEFRKLDLEAKTLQAKQNKLPKEATAVAEAKQTAAFLGLEDDEAKEFVRQQITGETSSSQEKVDFVLETHDLVLDMLDQNSVGAGLMSAVGSMAGRIPSMREGSADFDNAHAKLQARLSKDNFGLMKGVLSDNDIKMLIAIGTGTLNLVGSEEAYIRELSKIRTKLENSLGKQGAKIPVREGTNYHNLASSDENEITSEGGFTIKIVE